MTENFELQKLLYQGPQRQYQQKSVVPRFATKQLNQYEGGDSADFSQARLTELPQLLRSIRILNLNDNYIKVIDLSNLPNLEILTIRNNLLQDFQFQESLIQLDISQNHIKQIRPNINRSIKLEHLYIAHNTFTDLPIELLELKYNLTIFHLDWFRYGDPPMQDLFSGSEMILALFNQLKSIFSLTKVTNLSVKTLLSHPLHRQFALKFSTEQSIPFPLHHAILAEDVGVVRLMIGRKINLEQQNEEGISPLCLAIMEEKYLSARYLLEAGVDPNQGGGCYGNALNVAVSKLQYFLVKDLIRRGSNVNLTDLMGNGCIHYLFMVFSLNETEAKKILLLLLQGGANPNIPNSHGLAALHVAVHKGQANILQYVHTTKDLDIAFASRFNFMMKTTQEKFNCLHIAVMTRNINMVKLLVQIDEDLIFGRNILDLTPMDFLKNDLTIFKYLKGVQKGRLRLRLSRSITTSEISHEWGSETTIIHKQVHSACDFSNLRRAEIVRSIPLSHNNLKIVEEKNQLMSCTKPRVEQARVYKVLKKLAYTFEQLSVTSVPSNDYLAIKQYLFALNKVKDLISLDEAYKLQWLLLMQSIKQLPICDTISQNSTSQNGYVRIFNSMIKNIESAYLGDYSLQFKEIISESDMNFILNYFLSIHCGFGLGRLLVNSRQLQDFNQYESFQIRGQLQHLKLRYNIFNYKSLLTIFT